MVRETTEMCLYTLIETCRRTHPRRFQNTLVTITIIATVSKIFFHK